jgi:hypothetical protein
VSGGVVEWWSSAAAIVAILKSNPGTSLNRATAFTFIRNYHPFPGLKLSDAGISFRHQLQNGTNRQA